MQLAHCHMNKGLVYAAMGRSDLALDEYTKSDKKYCELTDGDDDHPCLFNYAILLYNISKIYEQKGQYVSANNVVEKSIGRLRHLVELRGKKKIKSIYCPCAFLQGAIM